MDERSAFGAPDVVERLGSEHSIEERFGFGEVFIPWTHQVSGGFILAVNSLVSDLVAHGLFSLQALAVSVC